MVTTPNLTNDGQEAVLTVDAASIPNTNQGPTEDQVDVNNIPTSESNNIQVQVDADSVPTLNNANDDALVDADSVPARLNESRVSQNVDVNVTTVESNSSSGEDSLPFNRPPDQAPTSPTGDARPTNEEGKRQEEDDAATAPLILGPWMRIVLVVYRQNNIDPFFRTPRTAYNVGTHKRKTTEFYLKQVR